MFQAPGAGEERMSRQVSRIVTQIINQKSRENQSLDRCEEGHTTYAIMEIVNMVNASFP
jgi:hypothetical protein